MSVLISWSFHHEQTKWQTGDGKTKTTNLVLTPFSFPLCIQDLIRDFSLGIKKSNHFIELIWIFEILLTPRWCIQWKVKLLPIFLQLVKSYHVWYKLYLFLYSVTHYHVSCLNYLVVFEILLPFQFSPFVFNSNYWAPKWIIN